MKLPPYDTAIDPDLLTTGVRIEPEDHERFPLPPHKHNALRPFVDCPACDEKVRSLAERNQRTKEAIAAAVALTERLAREKDEFFAEQRSMFVKLERDREVFLARQRRLRNEAIAATPPAPKTHPIAPLPCQICGRLPAQHTLMANGALACWTSAQGEPRDDAGRE